MTIVVRVLSSRAQAQMAALQAQTTGLAKTSAAASAASARIAGPTSLQNLTRFGNQLQWTGRQLQYNFTLPLVLAGAAATKWALDNEKAFVHVKKVYGDTGAAQKQFMKENAQLTQQMAQQKATRIFNAELVALQDSFRALSEQYGVAQKDVLDIAGSWAAAGASGIQLARSVETTMKAIVIGDIDAAKATEALIAIQGQYNLNSQELSQTLAYLNSIENQTGISMAGLIDGFARAAGQARQAGIDVRHLGAMLAAMVPYAGSAAQAGNGLRTMISRLMAPTQEATDILNEMGLAVSARNWQTQTATERLKSMAEEFANLGGAAQNQAAAIIASRWQVNRFAILMDAIVDPTSSYAKALSVTADSTQTFTVLQKELNAVLTSSPQQLKQTWVILQNAMAQVVVPLIPYLLYLVNQLKEMVTWFSNLNPEVQKFVIFGLAMLAVVGPLTRYVGSLTTLFATLGRAVEFTAGAFGLLTVTTEAADGEITKTRGAFWRFLKLLTITPLLKFGAAVGFVFTALADTMFWFFTTGTRLVASAFLWPRIIATSFGVMLTVTKARLAVMQGWMAVGFTKMRLIMLAASIEGATVWGQMWAALKWMTLSGIAFITRGMFGFSLITKIWTTVGVSLVATWRGTWAAIQGIAMVAWTRLKLISLVGSLEQVGIFTKLRGMLWVVWTATAGGLKAIWMAMWRTIVAITAVGSSGVVGVFTKLGALLLRFGKFLVSPWALAALAILGIVYALRDKIAIVWNNIVDAISGSGIADAFEWLGNQIMHVFEMLPEGVQQAMISVVRVVAAAAEQVYEWFQYLNPFAQHSPSLVDNVQNGVAAINNSFATLTRAQHDIQATARAVEDFKRATKGMQVLTQESQNRENRQVVSKLAPGALDEYDRLVALLPKLQSELERVNKALQAQQTVVDAWQKKVDQANDALDRQQNKLQELQDKLSKYQDLLSEAQDRLSTWASTPIKGMEAMEDRIFRNEMAQKRLRLEMMRMEDAVGTLDEIHDKMAAINGQQELLRGEQSSLRAAGAGSEILGTYDKEIAKLDQQKDKYAETADKLQEMQDKLDALQRAAEKLDLIKALKFDALQRRIEKAANTIKEMSFEDIMRGIRDARGDVERYQHQVDKASKAVERQQQVVDKLTNHRDKLQDRLDAETKTLNRIQGRYDAINDAISSINDTLGDIVGSAKAANDALAGGSGPESASASLEAFRAAGNATFPDPGGSGFAVRKNWESQVPQIENFTKRISARTASMFEDINPFKPLMDKASGFFSWLGEQIPTWADNIGKAFGTAFAGTGISIDGSKIKGIIKGIAGVIREVAGTIAGWAKTLWSLLGPDIMRFFGIVWDALKRLWDKVGPLVASFGELIKPFGQAIKNIWTILKPIIGLILVAFGAIAKVVLSTINGVLGPALNFAIDVIVGFVKVIRGILKIFIGIFTLNFKMIGDGIKDIFSGIFGVIISLFKNGFLAIIGAVKGFVGGIVGFFKWLWDQLVGHSIIPDIVNGIIWWFEFLTTPIRAVFDLIVGIIKWFIKAATTVLGRIISFFRDRLGPIFKWLWQNIVKPVLGFIIQRIRTFWQGAKIIFTALHKFIDEKLGPIFEWLWNKVIKPVFGWIGDKIKDTWNNVIKPILTSLRDFFRNVVGPVFQWLWDNVVKPVWDKIGSAIHNAWTDYIKPTFEAIRDFITEHIVPAFRGLKDVAETAFKAVANKVRVPINFVLDTVYNNGIKWLFDKVADAIGLSWTLPEADTIDPFRTGGPIRGPGTGTSDSILARLSKGEHVWTASEVRNAGGHGGVAALRKFYGRGHTMNQITTSVRQGLAPDNIPGFFLGGAWDWVQDKTGDAKDWVVTKSLDWVAGKASDTINGLMTAYDTKIGDIARVSMLTLVDKSLRSAAETANVDWNSPISAGGPGIEKALAFANDQAGKPYRLGAVGPSSYDCSGFMSALTNVIRGKPPYHRVGSTGTWPWDGFTIGQTGGFTIGSTSAYPGSSMGHMAGTLGGVNVESRGDVGVLVGPSARGYNDSGFTSFGYINGLGKGGVVRATNRGSLWRLGEGGNDELVTPLPNNWSNGGLGREVHNHFYGDLEFPNVKNGSDAEAFISNLETLARS